MSPGNIITAENGNENLARKSSIHGDHPRGILGILRPGFLTAELSDSAYVPFLRSGQSMHPGRLLRTHCDSLLETAKVCLSSHSLPEDLFSRSLSFVHGWAHRQLGRRLSDAPLDFAVKSLTELHDAALRPSASTIPPHGVLYMGKAHETGTS